MTDHNSNQPISWTRKTEPKDIALCCELQHQAYTQKLRSSDYVPFPSELAEGIVLEHKDHGIIGFAVWNKEKLHITNICVLPDHRRHSSTLINGLIAYARENYPEQWFTANLLETTSYPLVKAMSIRGSLELEEGEIGHYLQGVPCINVKMRGAQGREQAQQQAIPPEYAAALEKFRRNTTEPLHRPQKPPSAGGHSHSFG
jgi:hypothetical protein